MAIDKSKQHIAGSVDTKTQETHSKELVEEMNHQAIGIRCPSKNTPATDS